MKYYMSEVGNRPLVTKAGKVTFEQLSYEGGGITRGIFATDDTAISDALDKIVGTRGLLGITAAEYAEAKKKVVPPNSGRPSPRPFSMLPVRAVTKEPAQPSPTDEPGSHPVEIEDIMTGQQEADPVADQTIKEIKSELDSRGVDHSGVKLKADLVSLLEKAQKTTKAE